MTIGETEIQISTAIQEIYGDDEAKAIARLVLCHICNISPVQLILRRNDMLYKTEQRSVSMILDELLTGKPVQYILGETTFYGFRLKVSPAVLIPRPETEELVEWILQECRNRTFGAANDGLIISERILDIGTGSGCIPIALNEYLPGAKVFGIDISADALQIAGENARANEADVHFFQADILNPSGSPQLLDNTPFTIIISNPPYITESEREHMHPNVIDYEPHTALFVPDRNPLLFYHAIADFASYHLAKKGLLFLEINEFLAHETMALLEAAGFKNCELRNDLQGKGRMVKAETGRI